MACRFQGEEAGSVSRLVSKVRSCFDPFTYHLFNLGTSQPLRQKGSAVQSIRSIRARRKLWKPMMKPGVMVSLRFSDGIPLWNLSCPVYLPCIFGYM